ncbi:hypothetical protein BDU57DRAFT_364252 [Ampelomyces quisqualis]|uniref:Uncharacterized protein n=1 Tax=Ampelomyces quisqualis TaxID=50730 RepID=A0A6A5QC43_AMPQU|nr:hypothetical protein BDU57DRAFT_364252 [Ampelomyces quisqualis]
MSQRGCPSSAHGDPQRMPFDAAEALLWGKKTHNEHKFLFPRMRELEEQHRAYDTRIQATETIAEAAEAATSRIRRIEQQIAAIESDEQDRPFDKWVQEEITAVKGFMEKNKSVRQKQVELENKMAALEESVDKSREASSSRDIEILLERISRLENERIGNTNRITRLERDVIELTVTRRIQVVEGNALLAAQTQKPIPRKPCLPAPRQSALDASEAEAETEDEDVQPLRRKEQIHHEQVLVHRSPPPMPKISSNDLLQPFIKDRDHTSARLRMMQRHSIYDPKQPRQNEQPHARAPICQQPSNSRPAEKAIPATQIASRPGAGVLTSGGAHTPDHLPRKELIVKLNYRKRKAGATITAPRVTRSQAKKNNEATQDIPEATSGVEIQTVKEPPAKRRRPNSNIGKQVCPKEKEVAKITTTVTSNAACLVKTSPRKAVMASQRDGSARNLAQISTKALPSSQQLLVSPRKKEMAHSESVASLPVPIGPAPARLKNNTSSSVRTVSPKKPATSSRSIQKKRRHGSPLAKSMASSSTAGPQSSPSKAAPRRRQRPMLTMLVTPDQATLDAMERDDTLLL